MACSVLGLIVGMGACAAIVVGSVAHAALGAVPVLSGVPLFLGLVVAAFGLGGIVAEGIPLLVEGRPHHLPHLQRERGGSTVGDNLRAVPVLERCMACGSVFAEGIRGVGPALWN
jgi:hypothetical protein